MAVPFSNTKLRVPRGFQNLLEGFAREVLRKQPEDLDLYAFGAEYFEGLLQAREEGGIDPAEHGAKQEDRFYNNKAFTEPEIDPSDPQQQDAALAIQTKFRQHAAKQEVDGIREEKAATKIQAGFRGYQGRQEVQKKRSGMTSPSKEIIKQAEEEEEVDIDLNDPEVEAAAVKIQAGFKGFKARQDVQRVKEYQSSNKPTTPPPVPSPPTAAPTAGATPTTETAQTEPQCEAVPEQEEEVDIDLTDPEVENAAIKIQAGFKGMKSRREVKAMRDETESSATAEDVLEGKEDTTSVPAAASDPEVDIDLTDPDVEQAAVKIQAGFKGMKARREVQEIKRTAQFYPAYTPGPEDTRQLSDDDMDLSNPDVEQATVRIQAGVRGMEVRNEMQQDQDDKNAATGHQQQQQQQEEEIDIDLNDPEVEKAALKIQAGFKGFKAKKSDSKKSGQTKPAENDNTTTSPVKTPVQEQPATIATPVGGAQDEEIDIDLDDPEVEKAAVKIQAGFKGMQARRSARSAKQVKSGGDKSNTAEGKPSTPTDQPDGGQEKSASPAAEPSTGAPADGEPVPEPTVAADEPAEPEVPAEPTEQVTEPTNAAESAAAEPTETTEEKPASPVAATAEATPAEEAPVAADTEAPTAADTKPPTVAADTEVPTAADTEAPPADTEAPVAADTESPVAADTEEPPAADTEPPTVAADTEVPTAADTEVPTAADIEAKTEEPVAE